MKKIYALCIGIICFSKIDAQFKTGQKLVGPSLGIGYYNEERESTNMSSLPVNNRNSNAFNILIGVSCIKMKNESSGIGFGITYGFDKNRSRDKTTNIFDFSSDRHTVGISGFKRKFMPLKGKWNFYYDAGLNASFSTLKSTSNNSSMTFITKGKESIYRSGLFLTPGVTYQFKKNLLFDAAFTNIISGNYTLENSNSENTSGEKFKNKRAFANISSTLNTNDFLRNITISLRWIM